MHKKSTLKNYLQRKMYSELVTNKKNCCGTMIDKAVSNKPEILNKQ